MVVEVAAVATEETLTITDQTAAVLVVVVVVTTVRQEVQVPQTPVVVAEVVACRAQAEQAVQVLSLFNIEAHISVALGELLAKILDILHIPLRPQDNI
jgi:hypothetical protein